MKNLIITIIAFAFLACNNNSKPQVESSNRIQHTVMFNLKYEHGSPEEKLFLEDSQRILSSIPVVQNFEVKRQVSPKNTFDFYFTMYFASKEDYDSYNNSPEHIKYVSERWKAEVVAFQEADFLNYP